MTAVEEWVSGKDPYFFSSGLMALELTPFTIEFLKWIPSLNLDKSIVANRDVSQKAPDEMADNEPSHLDLHCWQRYQFWSARLKGLSICRQ